MTEGATVNDGTVVWTREPALDWIKAVGDHTLDIRTLYTQVGRINSNIAQSTLRSVTVPNGTSEYQLDQFDRFVHVRNVDGPVTITMPAYPGPGYGQQYTISKVHPSAHDVSIVVPGGYANGWQGGTDVLPGGVMSSITVTYGSDQYGGNTYFVTSYHEDV